MVQQGKFLWVLLVIVVVLGGIILFWQLRSPQEEVGVKPTQEPAQDMQAEPDIITRAYARYQEAVAAGRDLSKGPCLGIIDSDWVLDIAHNPRQPVDDDPANQCPEFRSGKVKHFIEFTPEGEFIRMR